MIYLYSIIILLMTIYLILNLYFEWKTDKWVKRYENQINKHNELEQQKKEVL